MVLAVVFGLLLGAAGVYAYFMMRGSQPPGTDFTEGSVGQQQDKAPTPAPPPVSSRPEQPASPPSTATARATDGDESRTEGSRPQRRRNPDASSSARHRAAPPCRSTVAGAAARRSRWRTCRSGTSRCASCNPATARRPSASHCRPTHRPGPSRSSCNDRPQRRSRHRRSRHRRGRRPRGQPPRLRPASRSHSPVPFTSTPARAARACCSNGKVIGTTPMRIPDIAVGSHIIKLQLDDHSDWTTSTRVVSGQETRVTGSLERIR